MQASHHHGHDHDLGSDFAAKLSEDLQVQLRVNEELENTHNDEEVAGAGGLEEEEEEEFSFMCGGGNASPIAAEDAFVNGQIKPIFPLFSRELLGDEEGLPARPQVKKVFVEMKDDDDDDEDDNDGRGTMLMAAAASASTANGEVSGPYCEWSKDTPAPEPEPEGCKKSNSTGFSKLWRFRDLLHRSNSDGRDAFVFLNSQPTTSSVVKKGEKKAVNGGGGGEVKVNDRKAKAKKGGKSKVLSPHEIYLKSKAKEDGRKRSYLPYRPEVFGLFTNVNGGVSRNVHPF